jgi:hypothetical protein
VPELVHQRCYRHRQREAAARCLGCERFFCRECVTEHRGRVLCSDCLTKGPDASPGADSKSVLVLRFLQFAGGSLLIWFVFYLLGYLLLSIPSAFHDGTIWQQPLKPG